MLILKSYVQLYSHGVWENTNTGIKIAPDLFQNVISKLVQDMEYIMTYLEDLLILTKANSSFKHHLLKLEIVLARLSTTTLLV
jgi:hypothetical protein